ncbi:MAG: AI-2E family transporter [Verrucomicrobiales bacterium]|nr:AI-2E family transporter [Verrucomicrobiales bacterium]
MPAEFKTPVNRGTKFLLALGCIVVVVGGLKLAADLLVPIVLAFFLSVISLPILRWLRSIGIPRFPAVFLTVIVGLGVLSPVVFIGLNMVTEFQNNFDVYNEGLTKKVTEFQEWVEETLDYEMTIDAQDVISTIQSSVFDFIGGAAGFLKDFTFVVILMIFFLSEAGGFSRKLIAIRRANGPDLAAFTATAKDVQKYLGIKTLISFMTGILAAAVTGWLGLEFALLWGMVAFIFNYIPAIGSIIASIPPTLLALVDKSPGVALTVLIGFLIINMILGNFVEPMLLGKRFGISTAVIVLSVVFWGWLWGITGMFLAVPLTMLLKVTLNDSDEFKWFAVFLGSHDSEAQSQSDDVDDAS